MRMCFKLKCTPFYKKNFITTRASKLVEVRTNQEQAETELLQNAVLSNVFSQNRGFLAMCGFFFGEYSNLSAN